MTYEEHHAALIAYLLVKVEARDWHGVSDAANDLRVLEATSPETKRICRCGLKEGDLLPEACKYSPHLCSRQAAYAEEAIQSTASPYATVLPDAQPERIFR